MVMATGSVCHQYGVGDLPHEAGEASDEAGAAAAALHERLVAYVHALAGGHEPRSGVWVEHSYARARGSHAPAAHVRVLLAPRAEPEHDALDVERVDPPPPDLPDLPDLPPDAPDSDADDGDSDWEASVAALAPTHAHACLVSSALETLRRLRLAHLASRGTARLEATRTAARRLRLALGAVPQPRAAAWLHSALLAHMPRAVRRLYEQLTAQLRRSAPRLAGRMLGAGEAPRDPLDAVGPAVGPEARVWLVWLSCGRARLDARWSRRLGALVHVRVLGGGGSTTGAPDVWCAAVAGSVRAALADTLAEVGDRAVILGGIGCGAALCVALATGCGAVGGAGAARLRGLLLLAPPLLTAEGARDSPDDPLSALRLPVLLVAGTGAAQSWRGAVREVARARPEAAPRRVLELRGADDWLRLRGAARRRVPQAALDAAVAEECARWALEVADGDVCAEPPPERPRRREARAGLRSGDPGPRGSDSGRSASDAGGRGSDAGVRSNDAGLCGNDAGANEEDYAHLPTAVTPTASVEAGPARVVCRGSGATPLALPPPRRALGAADIMRLPIVFADDAPDVTVTSGAARYTRVIVASRGRGSARPVLLRRGLRLLPKDRPR